MNDTCARPEFARCSTKASRHGNANEQTSKRRTICRRETTRADVGLRALLHRFAPLRVVVAAIAELDAGLVAEAR